MVHRGTQHADKAYNNERYTTINGENSINISKLKQSINNKERDALKKIKQKINKEEYIYVYNEKKKNLSKVQRLTSYHVLRLQPLAPSYLRYLHYHCQYIFRCRHVQRQTLRLQLLVL